MWWSKKIFWLLGKKNKFETRKVGFRKIVHSKNRPFEKMSFREKVFGKLSIRKNIFGKMSCNRIILCTSWNFIPNHYIFTGVMFPGFIMVLQIFLGSNKVLSIIIFTLALAANGFVTGGYLGNSLELAPNYSGTLISFSKFRLFLFVLIWKFTRTKSRSRNKLNI